jgi:hypothetical protein
VYLAIVVMLMISAGLIEIGFFKFAVVMVNSVPAGMVAVFAKLIV